MAERRGGGDSHASVAFEGDDERPRRTTRNLWERGDTISSTTTNQQSQKVAVRRDTETNCLRTGSDDTSSPLVQ